jgi:hypothetical protein
MTTADGVPGPAFRIHVVAVWIPLVAALILIIALSPRAKR